MAIVVKVRVLLHDFFRVVLCRTSERLIGQLDLRKEVAYQLTDLFHYRLRMLYLPKSRVQKYDTSKLLWLIERHFENHSSPQTLPHKEYLRRMLEF